MSAVLLFKMEVAALALHNFLLWFSSDLPIVPLCPLLSGSLKTVDAAILLMTIDLCVFFPTVKTFDDLWGFSGV